MARNGDHPMTAYTSLRDFIERLEKDGDLVRITEEVSTDREMTEIHKRVLHKGGPALLFENVVHEDGRRSWGTPCFPKTT